MILRKLEIERQIYGRDKGKLTGCIRWSDEISDISFSLNEDHIRRIFSICAEAIEEIGREAAQALVCRVIDQKIENLEEKSMED